MASSLELNRVNSRRRAIVFAIVLASLSSSQLWMPNWENPVLATAESGSIAGHRVVRVFNARNSPIVERNSFFHPGKLHQDRAGRLWIAPSMTLHRMVATLEETTGRWMFFGERQDPSLTSLNYKSGVLIPSTVSRVVESRSGEIWFVDDSVIRDSGVSRPYLSSFDGKSWHAHDIVKDITGFMHVGIFSDVGGTLRFWAGEELWSYDGKRWSRIFDSLKNLRLSHRELDSAPEDERGHYGNSPYEIFDVLKDREGLWWFATGGGVRRFDEKRKEWKRFPRTHLTQFIYEDKVGRLWFADTDKASVYSKAEDSTRTFGLTEHLPEHSCGDSYPTLNSIYQDRRGQMLFGHACGLICYNEAKATWDFVNLVDVGLNNEVEDILEDRSGKIWVSTRSGLVVLDP